MIRIEIEILKWIEIEMRLGDVFKFKLGSNELGSNRLKIGLGDDMYNLIRLIFIILTYCYLLFIIII